MLYYILYAPITNVIWRENCFTYGIARCLRIFSIIARKFVRARSERLTYSLSGRRVKVLSALLPHALVAQEQRVLSVNRLFLANNFHHSIPPFDVFGIYIIPYIAAFVNICDRTSGFSTKIRECYTKIQVNENLKTSFYGLICTKAIPNVRYGFFCYLLLSL